MSPRSDCRYVSRGGLKLAHAIEHFQFDVTGLRCADLGCSVGGFSDCLLQNGAAQVHAVDTAYGILDYTIRRREEVMVYERTNALHIEPPAQVDLVVIDLGWTNQRRAIPAALDWLGPNGHIITLVKPHYELDASQKEQSLTDGCLDATMAEQVFNDVLAQFEELNTSVLSWTESPIRGLKSEQRRPGHGNREYLVLLSPKNTDSDPSQEA
ncbi:MAG: SAM-dependent methyltransferase [Phycisphaerales bacterium]|nr:SAM-dependent methyltransferase [Phycisphaerales bacterium]